MRRVVVTGMGVVSCLGNDLDTCRTRCSTDAPASAARRRTRSAAAQPGRRSTGDRPGSRHRPARSAIHGRCLCLRGDRDAPGYRRQWTRTGPGLDHGRAHSGLRRRIVIECRRGRRHRPQPRGAQIGPTRVPRTMCSTVAACLGTTYHIKGTPTRDVRCATSAHCIGVAAEQIQLDKQDVVFCGAAKKNTGRSRRCSMRWRAVGRLQRTPERASRAYDAHRDGFVIAGGGGMLVVEELEHARARGARIYAELVGYGATADGHDMVAPSGEGAMRCMRQALSGVSVRSTTSTRTARHATGRRRRARGGPHDVRADHLPPFVPSRCRAFTGAAGSMKRSIACS